MSVSVELSLTFNLKSLITCIGKKGESLKKMSFFLSEESKEASTLMLEVLKIDKIAIRPGDGKW
jgi:hypothetical protein